MADEPRCPECMGHRGLPRMIHDGDDPRECTNLFHSEIVAPEPELEQEQIETAAPVPLKPTTGNSAAVCPYCGANPCNLKGKQGMIGPAMIIIVRCANDACQKFLGIVPLGLASGPAMPVGGGPVQ
jgi:hypothetical protein